MCGICGYISKKKIEDKILEQMRDTMIHRGPNDAGIWQKNTSQGYVGLAHRRLSIFDLSELGHQPMHSEDGLISVVFNGEIYNFKEIRVELEKDGFKFKSNCDTEVIIYSYAKWKEECFSKFNGMFAISIWDSREEKLVIARDRMGVKPFYYFWNKESNDFVFSSELKPIMEYPYFHKDIDMEALGNYLCYKYIASPRTIFKNTYKLNPGYCAIYKNNELKVKCYWNITEKKEERSKKIITDFATAKKELNDILTDAVIKRMVADVPVGTFLSSGIDSALVTAIAQKNSNSPVRTFTIGFNEKERNEADRAKKIAEYLGTDHTELYIGEKEIYDMLGDITDYYDEPFADSSQLPTMLVSKLASDNVTVALSGDGGDELFCGYKMYDLVHVAQLTDPIGEVIHKFSALNDLFCGISPEIKAFIDNRGAYRTQLFADVFSKQVKQLFDNQTSYCVLQNNCKFDFEKELTYHNWQERRMLLDMVTYLPDEVMCKTDRASMKYSLEVRSPILDYRVVEKSFEISHDLKCRRGFKDNSNVKNAILGDKKYILKSLAYDYIPKDLLSGPKKGFGVPLAKWLRGPLSDEILKYADSQYLKKQGIFDPDGVQKLIYMQKKNDMVLYSSILWSYYMFQRWWERYM